MCVSLNSSKGFAKEGKPGKHITRIKVVAVVIIKIIIINLIVMLQCAANAHTGSKPFDDFPLRASNALRPAYSDYVHILKNEYVFV